MKDRAISPISEARRARLREYKIVAERWRARPENEWCACCVVRRADRHPHHVITRSLRPDLLCDETNFLPVCFRCHREIHDHPAESYKRGWLGHSWESPAEVAKKRKPQDWGKPFRKRKRTL